MKSSLSPKAMFLILAAVLFMHAGFAQSNSVIPSGGFTGISTAYNADSAWPAMQKY